MKRTMTPAQEAAMRREPVSMRSEHQNTPVTRKRAYTIEDLWEKWAIFCSKFPNTRDGLSF